MSDLIKGVNPDGATQAIAVDADGALIVSTDLTGANIDVLAQTEYTEDDAAAANPDGTAIILVRTDTLATNTVTADGDNIAARATSKGELYVKQTDAVPPAATTSGGCSTFHLVSAATDNATNVKAAAGQVYAIDVFNKAAYPVYVKFHNDAGTPTAGADVVRTVGVAAASQHTVTCPVGIAFAAGIAITIVKDIADNGTTAVASADCVVDIDYK